MKRIHKLSILFTGMILLFSCKKDFHSEEILHSQGHSGNNIIPIASAGDDQVTMLPKDSVLLDGSQSTDPDGTITRFQWKKISASTMGIIVRTDSAKTTVCSLNQATHVFELIVTDNKGASARDTVRVTVNNPNNLPPVANAGNDINNLFAHELLHTKWKFFL